MTDYIRQFLSWQGEDLTPEYDFTEPTSNVHVIWDKVEVGGKAWKGQADVGSVPLRDERAETGSAANLPSDLSAVSIAAHNRWRWTENGSNTMARGWIGPKDYRRHDSGLAPDRYREIGMSVLDANAQLQGIIVDANRPLETDVARVQWLASTYLAGSPRPTTNLATTYLAAGSNTVTLPAQHLDGDPRSILEEIANFANKQFFITSDEELFYDGNDSTSYFSTLAISDRLDEQNTTLDCTGPIFIEGAPLGVLGTGSPIQVPMPTNVSAGQFLLMQVWINNLSRTANTPSGWTLLKELATADERAYLFGKVADGTEGGTNQDVNFTGSTGGGRGGYSYVFSGVDASDFADTVTTGGGTGDTLSAPSVAAVGANRLFCAFNTMTPGTGSPDFCPEFTGETGGDWQVAAEKLATGSSIAIRFQLQTATGTAISGGTSTAPDASFWTTFGVPLRPSGFAAPNAACKVFPPIWDVGPSATEDGQQLLSGLRMYYGQGSNTYVYVSDPTTANSYAHFEESLYAPESITTAAAATTLANAILYRRKYEERNINVSIGPLTIDQAVQVKYGQLIPIKARAIAFADDQYFTGRIRQLRWTTPVPGMFFAHMQIERPIKDVPYGVGNKSGSSAISGHLTQGSNAHPEYVTRTTLAYQGDIPYRGASDWTRLGIGGSNTRLASDGTKPVWMPRSALTVKEEDASPLIENVTEIRVTNGSLTDNGGGSVSISTSGGSGGAAAPSALIPVAGLSRTGSSTVGSANNAIHVLTYCPGSATITGLRFRVEASSGNIDVGIYDSSGNRLASSGSTACPATGIQTVSFSSSVAITSGWYYLALCANNNTAQFSISTATGSPQPGAARVDTSSGFPLPATSSLGATETSVQFILIGLVSGGWP